MADNQNSKSGTFINDPAHWRDRAQQMRVLAEDMNDEYSKAAMLRIAEEYERLAKRAEQRASGNYLV